MYVIQFVESRVTFLILIEVAGISISSEFYSCSISLLDLMVDPVFAEDLLGSQFFGWTNQLSTSIF